MSDMPVLETRDEAVLTITLNRPDALNAFDRAMKEALLKALKAAERDRDARVVVLTGAGRAFSAGQDLKERTAADATPLGVRAPAALQPDHPRHAPAGEADRRRGQRRGRRRRLSRSRSPATC